jgi:hypothetical protein
VLFFLNQDNERLKKIHIGGGGAPAGAGTALDPERITDPKHVLVYGICITLSKVAL